MTEKFMDMIVAVVDRSGSMRSIKEDAEGGLNEFLLEQQKNGLASLTLAEFDDEYVLVHDDIDLAEFKEYNLNPRGMTALFDAIGKTAANVKESKSKGKKIFLIVTDGGENSSKEWRVGAEVAKLIGEMRDDKWEFVFIGADEESLEQAESLGLDTQSMFMFDKSGKGAKDSYAAATSYTSSLRGGMPKAMAVDELDKTIANSGGTLKKAK